jgi:hypothetical protein
MGRTAPKYEPTDEMDNLRLLADRGTEDDEVLEDCHGLHALLIAKGFLSVESTGLDRARALRAALIQAVESSTDHRVAIAARLIGLVGATAESVAKQPDTYGTPKGPRARVAADFAVCSTRTIRTYEEKYLSALYRAMHDYPDHKIEQALDGPASSIPSMSQNLATEDEAHTQRRKNSDQLPTSVAVSQARHLAQIEERLPRLPGLRANITALAQVAFLTLCGYALLDILNYMPVGSRRRLHLVDDIYLSLTLTLLAACFVSCFFSYAAAYRAVNQPERAISEEERTRFSQIFSDRYRRIWHWVVSLFEESSVVFIASAIILAALLCISWLEHYQSYTADTLKAHTIKTWAPLGAKIYDLDFNTPGTCAVDKPAEDQVLVQYRFYPFTTCSISSGDLHSELESENSSVIGLYPVEPRSLHTSTNAYYIETRFRPTSDTPIFDCGISIEATGVTIVPADDRSIFVRIAEDGGLGPSYEVDAIATYLAHDRYMTPKEQGYFRQTLQSHSVAPMPFIGRSTIPGWSNGSWTTLGIYISGDIFTVFVDDRVELESKYPGLAYIERANPAVLADGRAGGGVASCDFDYFTMRQVPQTLK